MMKAISLFPMMKNSSPLFLMINGAPNNNTIESENNRYFSFQQKQVKEACQHQGLTQLFYSISSISL
jgi:hypothetical protein